MGPDRRNLESANQNSDLSGFEVPNGLCYKAPGDIWAKVDVKKIELANRIVSEHCLRRSTLQFGYIASTLERSIKENPGQAIPRDRLSEMIELVNYIARQTEDDGHPEISELVN